MLQVRINGAIKSNINLIVPWYLILSYSYYCLDESLVEDYEYDELAKLFLSNYDIIKHRHKQLVSKDALRAGTLFSLRENDYPLIVRSALNIILKSKDEGI